MNLSDQWCTPQWLTDLLGNFDIDPCSNDNSTVMATASYCGNYPNDNGLTAEWERGTVFMNPPYSNPLPWCRRLIAHEYPWCTLLKLDPTTRWWATLMTVKPTVAPFRKRIKFEGSPGSKSMTANFPSVLIYKDWTPCHKLVEHLWAP